MFLTGKDGCYKKAIRTVEIIGFSGETSMISYKYIKTPAEERRCFLVFAVILIYAETTSSQ